MMVARNPGPTRGSIASLQVSAPGKLLLSGEYSVVLGRAAVVLAVDRRAVARLPARPGIPSSRLTRAAAQLVGEELNCAPVASELTGTAMPPSVDSGPLYHDQQKLGMGSSAAAAVSTVGALLAASGERLDTAAGQRRVFRLSRAAQAAAQGKAGSGVDVAASVYGGLLLFRRRDDPRQPPEVNVLPLDGLPEMSVIWTGRPVTTPERVAAFLRWYRATPTGATRLLDQVGRAAEAFAEAVTQRDTNEAVQAYRHCAEIYVALDQAAGLQATDDELMRLSLIAARHGGACKPSGAGAGDLAVALFAEQENRLAFERTLSSLDIRALDVAPCEVGVCAHRGGNQ
ncbi:MAG: hypothetical protein GY854_34340 [Deltaproteobacteria bacterium]|nr:hypothetical protein [Deltaproteobacteria bacterium]